MEGNKHGTGGRRTVLHRGLICKPLVQTDTASPFFNYGRGFFETILYDYEKLHFYKEHLNRMGQTCSDFHIELDFSEIAEENILHFLKKNNLNKNCCRVKIIYAPIEQGNRWDTIVTAEPYTIPGKDFVLSIHDEICDTKLKRYKSLNYEYNLYWKNYYREKDHSDEVLFINREGNILEGSYTNILFIRDYTLFYVDPGQNYLQGVMQDQILKLSKIKKLKLEPMSRGIPLNQLKDAEEVMICNSLMLVQNVRKIICGDEIFKWGSSATTDYSAPELRDQLLII